jgi:hypothetical protein
MVTNERFTVLGLPTADLDRLRHRFGLRSVAECQAIAAKEIFAGNTPRRQTAASRRYERPDDAQRRQDLEVEKELIRAERQLELAKRRHALNRLKGER